MKNYLVQCLSVCLLFSFSLSKSFAFEEEHEAHEHGHATLMLVQEKQKLQLVFKSPAMNIVGFEHQANSHEQEEKVHLAEQTLSDASRLFLINPNAQCTLKDLHVSSSLLAKNDEHGSHSEEEHDKHEEKSSHSEFEAEYDFDCKNLSALKEIRVALFDVFTSIEEIEAQIITDSGQKLLELDHNNTSIKF